MKKQFLAVLLFTACLISCSGDDSTTTNDDNPPVANNNLRIMSLPNNGQFAFFRIDYEKIKNINGVETSFSSSIKSGNGTAPINIDLDEYYEEGATNYLEITRQGTLLPANVDVGIFLKEPNLKYYVEDDFTDYVEWWELNIEVKKINGVYSFTKV